MTEPCRWRYGPFVSVKAKWQSWWRDPLPVPEADWPLGHNFEHGVVLTLQQMYRVLKPDGFTLIQLPDQQEVARHIAEGKLQPPLYIVPIGPQHRWPQ